MERTWAAKRAKRTERAAVARQDVEQLLKGTLVQVQSITGLDWKEIGLHLFLVERKVWQPERQQHVVRVKMSEYPPPTGITWTKGKGVIGRCWDSKGFEAHDVRSAYAPYMKATREVWSTLSPKQRFGLDYDEFVHTKDFAGTILAAPILEDMGSRYIGCLSLDAPGNCFEKLSMVQVKEALQLAATTARGLVRNMAGA